MLSEKTKQNPSEILVPQKIQINREIFLEHYLNKIKDLTHSYVSTCIVKQAPEWFFRDWAEFLFLEDFTELSH